MVQLRTQRSRRVLNDGVEDVKVDGSDSDEDQGADVNVDDDDDVDVGKGGDKIIKSSI